MKRWPLIASPCLPLAVLAKCGVVRVNRQLTLRELDTLFLRGR